MNPKKSVSKSIPSDNKKSCFMLPRNWPHQRLSTYVLRREEEDGRCRVRSLVTLFDLAVRRFPCFFFRNSRKYGLGSLKNSLTEGIPPTGPCPRCGQLALSLQPTTTSLGIESHRFWIWCSGTVVHAASTRNRILSTLG